MRDQLIGLARSTPRPDLIVVAGIKSSDFELLDDALALHRP
jgi:hypothetical protein